MNAFDYFVIIEGVFVIGMILLIIKVLSKRYHGDIIPKELKTFQGLLHNTTMHTFREIKIGYPEIGDLVSGGGQPPNDCAVWEHTDDMGLKPFKRLICELID